MACTVAPRNESKSEPVSPERVISGKSDQLSRKGTMSVSSEARAAIRAEPAKDASVPMRETPPEVPFSTRLRKSMIIRGGVGFKTPNSVAHVSALTAASEAANPIQPMFDSG